MPGTQQNATDASKNENKHSITQERTNPTGVPAQSSERGIGYGQNSTTSDFIL